MKIIGVEFRVGFRNHVMGQRQIEIFLHPLEIDCPQSLGGLDANATIHTSQGDQGMAVTLRYQDYGPVNQDEMARACKGWLAKYGCLER